MMKRELFDEVVEAVWSEIRHAGVWDEVRTEAGIPTTDFDADKSFNDWIGWAKLEIAAAEADAYYAFKKEDAMEHVRKAAGHLVRAMAYLGVRARTEQEREDLRKRAIEALNK